MSFAPAIASASSVSENIWWPTNGAHVSGTQPFKAMVSGLDVSQYEMFWQVDGGTWNWMDNNSTDYPHKEVSVDLRGWNWKGSGPYVVNFIARQNGTVIAQQSVTIYVDSAGQATAAAPATAPKTVTTSTAALSNKTTAPVITASVAAPTAVVQPTISVSSSKLYVSSQSDAATQAAEWGSSNPGTAAMNMLAAQPTAVWFGNWNSDVQSDANALVTAAAAQGATPTIVAYDIPERDCGGFSSGGNDTPSGYTAWINSLAAGIGNNKAIIVLEPDALAQITCLSSADQATRLSLIANAVTTLKKNPNASVYIDAGHSNWVDANTMAGLLNKAGVGNANGFSLNVSNFMATSDEINYGTQISSQLGGKHFIVDTSRNGNGSDGNWCNPSGRAIGIKPTVQTGNSIVDAFLWMKVPGESDGNCNGGPGAGQWWADYALQLVQNAHS